MKSIKVYVLRKVFEEKLADLVLVVGYRISAKQWREAADFALYGNGVTSAARDAGVFSDDECGLWNHRLKHGKMGLTKRELEEWL